MISLSLIAVPVLLDTTTEAPLLFSQWARMYHYGHRALPTMAVGTSALYSYIALKKRSAKQPWKRWFVAGLTTAAIIPFTLLVMVPTNDELFRLEVESSVNPLVMGIIDAQALVVKWSWLHLTRSFMPLVGAVLGAVWTFSN
jgi:Domain of unknown function (DUF1772)